MTEKQLKRLGRTELLGLLLDEVKKNEALEAKVRDLEERLNERSVLDAARDASDRYEQVAQKLAAQQEAFLDGMKTQFLSMESWKQMNEGIARIAEEQQSLRNWMTAERNGTRR